MAGDAFDDFYRRTYGALAGYALSLVGERAVAEDLAQEALVRVYARWGLLREPRPYAYRTVTNLARDRWRRRRASWLPCPTWRPTARPSPTGPSSTPWSACPGTCATSSCCITTPTCRSRRWRGRCAVRWAR